MGLFHNIRTAMALKSAMFARGIAACLSADANSDLMKDCGAPPKDIARMKLEAMRQRASQGGMR